MQISSSVIDANLAINDLSSLCILVVCRTPIILLRRSGWINKRRTFYYAACTLLIGIILARSWTKWGVLSTFPGKETNQRDTCYHHTGFEMLARRIRSR